jgi:hypothetical protein
MEVKNGTKFCPKIDQGSPKDHPRITQGSPKDLPRITQKRVLAKEKFLNFPVLGNPMNSSLNFRSSLNFLSLVPQKRGSAGHLSSGTNRDFSKAGIE